MKKGHLLLLASLLAGILAYCIGYRSQIAAQSALAKSSPELGWLKKEFHLREADFERIARLHNEYKPHCREMCRRIDEHNKRAQQLLLSTNQMTPEIETVLARGAELRAECQRDMLRHFYSVSSQMPPEQGRRYLEWVCRNTSVTDSSMESQ